jgi:hypothetical protein
MAKTASEKKTTRSASWPLSTFGTRADYRRAAQRLPQNAGSVAFAI